MRQTGIACIGVMLVSLAVFRLSVQPEAMPFVTEIPVVVAGATSVAPPEPALGPVSPEDWEAYRPTATCAPDPNPETNTKIEWF